MDIVYNNTKNVKFGDLKYGDVFMYRDSIYIKIKAALNLHTILPNAIKISSDAEECRFCNDDILVQPVKAKLVIGED